MECLIDDVWFLILKYLNLNERARLRLVSKKWKYFIDRIVIKKLIIFFNIPPTPGRLKMRNERFCLGDTVYVKNWDSFIENEFVAKYLIKSVEKLVIFSSGKRKICFSDNEFNRLFYLELHDAQIDATSKFLENNKIEMLFLYYRDQMDYFRQDLEDLEKMNKNFGFLKLLSTLKKLKHLNIRNKLTIEFFRKWRDILSKIEVLDVHVRDIKTLLFINNEYLSLKQLNVIVFEGLDKFASYLSPLCLNALKRKLRTNLKVYLYGIPFEKPTVEFICDYLSNSINQIKLCNSELTYIIDNRFEEMLCLFSFEQFLLDQLYENVNFLVFNAPYFDEQVFRKMYNVSYLNFNFKSGHVYNDLGKIFEIFTNLKEIKLTFEQNFANGNQILDMLPFYCWNIFSITVKTANQVNYDFKPILELKNLKYIKLTLANQFDHELLIEITNSLFYLTFFEINFNRPPAFTADHCKSVENELKFKLQSILDQKNLTFNVERQTTLDSDCIYYNLKKL